MSTRIRIAAGLQALLLVLTGLAITGPTALADPSTGDLHEVDRLPFFEHELDQARVWLVVNPKTRRGYQFFTDMHLGTTVVQSFDLDTLRPRRQAVFEGHLLPGGVSEAFVNGFDGDFLHAVDQAAGRIYFALHDSGLAGLAEFPKDLFSTAQWSASADGQRAVSRFVVLDERAFDEGRAAFAASFKSPVPEDHAYWLRSMAVRTGPEGTRLVTVMTTPHSVLVAGAGAVVHRVSSWDTSGLSLHEDATRQLSLSPRLATSWFTTVLTECRGASMTHGSAREGNYQWEPLLRPEGIYVVCQASHGSGKVVFLPLGSDGRPPTGAAQETVALLSRSVSDVLADGEGGRLLLKSASALQVTWWVFDAPVRRFVGSIAARDAAAGLDRATGRFYLRMPEHHTAAVRGGLFSVDTRLAPVPALDSRASRLAALGVGRIQVDPPTRRVFLHQGSGDHYLVLRDDRPPSVPPPPLDDRLFTVDTKERDGVTKASYLASGSGFGSRVLLVGGVAAATDRGAANVSRSACAVGDREVLLGQVESLTLSDLSAAGTSSSLAADADTEEKAGTPVDRCWPEAVGKDRPRGPDGEPVEVTALEFDADPEEHPGSDYRVQCVGDDDRAAAPRDGFAATVDCDQGGQRAEAEATGGGYVPGDAERGRPGVWVGYSHADVGLRRRPEGGVVVEAVAEARDVEIEGIGRIGLVRTVATAEAAGRDGTARTSFERTVCGVELAHPQLRKRECLDEDDQQTLVSALNRALAGRGAARLREPDPKLRAGSLSGYASAVQRDGIDLFADRVINRDASLTVPGLELVFYRGDDADAGAGRQILQLAGVQAGTSYGIACLHGQSKQGGCAEAGEEPAVPLDEDVTAGDGFEGAPPSSASGTDAFTADVDDGGEGTGRTGAAGGTRNPLVRLLRLPLQVAGDAWRLLTSSPGELGLVAAVWGLLYLPFHLGDRRRRLAAPAAARLAAEAP